MISSNSTTTVLMKATSIKFKVVPFLNSGEIFFFTASHLKNGKKIIHLALFVLLQQNTPDWKIYVKQNRN